jgi:ABC-type dipeptide/oligopeptide/nickel transport system permease component
VLNRDGFLLAGVVIVYCSLLVLFNLLVDLLYGLLTTAFRSMTDPRSRGSSFGASVVAGR